LESPEPPHANEKTVANPIAKARAGAREPDVIFRKPVYRPA
jgi:hypothetical protein